MRSAGVAALACLVVVLGACDDASPTPTPTPSRATLPPTASPTTTASPTATVPPPTVTPTATASPSPTPEPELSLDLPEERDGRVVAVDVAPQVDGGGRIVVTVVSQVDARIDELVLRWPTELRQRLFLAPFVPSVERIREGGPPLVVPWTKWVVGPGERGEPAGTTSLGYGPLPAGGTLEIPLHVIERRADEPVAFDLQVLAGESILDLPDGEPAELRVEVP